MARFIPIEKYVGRRCIEFRNILNNEKCTRILCLIIVETTFNGNLIFNVYYNDDYVRAASFERDIPLK